MIKQFSILLLVTLMIIVPVTDAFAQNNGNGNGNGQPFQELWDAIDNVESLIINLSVGWENIQNIPADIADGDDVGLMAGDSFFDIFIDAGELQAEEDARIAADDALSSDLAQEIADRQAADDALQTKTTDNMMDIGTIQTELQDLQLESHPAPLAGNGLLLQGNTFEVDSFVVQSRVNGECFAGESIRTINADGTVVCEVDTDTDTTYSGADFATSNQNCAVGKVVTGIAPNGALICADDAVGTGGSGGVECITPAIDTANWNIITPVTICKNGDGLVTFVGVLTLASSSTDNTPFSLDSDFKPLSRTFYNTGTASSDSRILLDPVGGPIDVRADIVSGSAVNWTGLSYYTTP